VAINLRLLKLVQRKRKRKRKRSRRLGTWVGAVLSLFLLLACPPSQQSSSGGSATGSPTPQKGGTGNGADAPCAKFGSPCTFSPGKLGTCIQREGCVATVAENCLICQSQH
jgi:hypothetical protein